MDAATFCRTVDGTRLQVMVALILLGPAGNRRELAHRIGRSTRAVGDAVAQLQADGLVDAIGHRVGLAAGANALPLGEFAALNGGARRLQVVDISADDVDNSPQNVDKLSTGGESKSGSFFRFQNQERKFSAQNRKKTAGFGGAVYIHHDIDDDDEKIEGEPESDFDFPDRPSASLLDAIGVAGTAAEIVPLASASACITLAAWWYVSAELRPTSNPPAYLATFLNRRSRVPDGYLEFADWYLRMFGADAALSAAAPDPTHVINCIDRDAALLDLSPAGAAAAARVYDAIGAFAV